ncbi:MULTISPECIES: type I restriction endonuclease [unclassified Nostoc]|uniref:type I restriction endonuclease n=1 Tax=unclassified Nostoc TaxID=2593658 RepID=UPI002AD58DA2|nr:type I restriction endonuclease [Nostoc sp. DedQUE03]MDZ7976989.1 type I restriction endonuclease [Nostoc sp. DedQUE03]MDZ8047554.1 type I restriction endonuclease [Nostoc sp. DedQUE02]
MDFIDAVKDVAQHIERLKDSVQTEQAAKAAFVLPLIQALGYKIFDTTEVCPEYIAATPGLKGEKVDYAILINGVPSILIECKFHKNDLAHPKNSSQLFRYFSATQARFAVLTNGIHYWFYTDTEKTHIMDEKPFFEFNILDFNESSINELKKFSREVFNPDEMASCARQLLYKKEISRLISEQFTNPSPDFVKLFAGQVYKGHMVAPVVEKFTEIFKGCLKDYINERINDKIRSAMDIDISDTTKTDVPDSAKVTINLNTEVIDTIVTTADEMESFYIIKSILRDVIELPRVQYRDTKNYFGVNIDGKANKTICRLWLNSEKKYVGFLDINNKEVKTLINSLDEIYKFANILKDRAIFLAKNKVETEVAEQ